MQRMHDSETPACRFERYRKIDLRLDTGQQIDEIDTYVANVGPAFLDGAQVALKEVAAVERNLNELSQHEMQCALRDMIDPQVDLDEFVLGSVGEDNKKTVTGEKKFLKNPAQSP